MILSGDGNEYSRVARPTVDDLVGDRPADDILAGAEHFEHRHAGSRAQVVGPPHARLQRFDG